MVKQNQSIMVLLPLFLILAVSIEAEAAKLFVFGDSYVDTGNNLNSSTYKPPYGMTYPGTSSGRYSDGRVLTDYLGIFKTLFGGPKLTVQIDSFEQLIKENVYSKSDVESSIFLVNSGGNDYVAFAVKDRNLSGIDEFRKSLITELSVNIRRIRSLGAKKILVSLLPPPVVSLYRDCFDLLNSASINHNTMLLQVVEDLNKEIGKPVVRTLDIYSSFQSAIQTIQKNSKGNFSIDLN
ncbi:unnamed protein product [Lupinus luteus]|uniref:GDSL esterase/lipase n=1 Tax=Lupinus luteus TaxID=3873 RepID=A0AAV1VRW1_LUPLU